MSESPRDDRRKFEDGIRELKHKDPFSPFNIVMGSGDKYLIEDPDMLIVGPVEIIYVVPRSGKTYRLRKSQVVAIEELEQRPAA
ncbi:MAG TPA: hypothetical protein VHM90_06695 [Phycisphaerae bacterium]|nr:hypothetical protein [Phycisphaerae bacterium]